VINIVFLNYLVGHRPLFFPNYPGSGLNIAVDGEINHESLSARSP
jgi:hypothetical protein